MNSGEDSAFPMISSSSSASHEYEGSVSMSPDSSWKSIAEVSSSGSCRGRWAHNLSEECILTGCRTPQLAETQGMFALALST